MLELIRKFLNIEIKKCRETLLEYYNKTDYSLNLIGTVEFPKEILHARSQLDAFTRTANFMDDAPPEITHKMTNEEALRTAIELFTDEAFKEKFNWFGGPVTKDEAARLIENSWTSENFTEGFVSLLYFWYYFQRTKEKQENK